MAAELLERRQGLADRRSGTPDRRDELREARFRRRGSEERVV
jgi:hypothetical protein